MDIYLDMFFNEDIIGHLHFTVSIISGHIEIC